MINIRFHIVSLVAVFLALGIGVAMGASFIDRATVETMQGRVDDLATGFRERGETIDSQKSELATQDSVAAALTEPGSRAVDGLLGDESIVLVVPSELPDQSEELITDVINAGGASVMGILRLQPALDPTGGDGRPSEDDVARLRDAIGDPAAPAGDVVELARTQLAQALAALSVAPPTVEPDTTQPGSGEPDGTATTTTDATGPDATTEPEEPSADGDGIVADPLTIEEAQAVVDRYSRTGLLGLDTGGLPNDEAFPAVSGVRYVMMIAPESAPAADTTLVPLVVDYGNLSAATMVVAAVGDVRNAGDLADPDAPDLGALLDPLRSGPVAAEVSTVQDATEPLARLALVQAVAAEREDVVGHFGIGDDVTAPFPPAAEEG